MTIAFARSSASSSAAARLRVTAEVVCERGDGKALDDAVVELERLASPGAHRLSLALDLGGAAFERLAQALHFCEPAERGVDRALKLRRVGLDDVGEDPALCSFVDPVAVVFAE